MAPRMSDRLLPDNASASAQNARLRSGELRGIRTPSRIHQFTTGTNKTVYRLYKDNGTAVWLGLSDPDADVVKGPLVNDTYNRHYWSGEEAYIAYNSDTRIENSDAPYKLGTPAPTTAPGLSVTGGSGTAETRSYCYTFVNSWGEESAPSPVVTISGFVNGTWNLTALETSGTDMTDRLPLTTKRIYRTVTGMSNVAYYEVAPTGLATATYDDTSDNSAVALNPILQTFSWQMPPATLEGLVTHPGGFLCAFDGRDLYFSERYRPHAWPVKYVLSVEHRIVGMTIYNNMLAVLTQGFPYFFQGTRPENMSPIKSQSAEPCLAKSSIAATIQGVLYTSPNGLVLLNEVGPNVATQRLMTVEEWFAYSPGTMRGAAYNEQYVGYYSSTNGIKFSPTEAQGVFVELDKFDGVDNVMTDHTTGDMWLIRDNDVYEWEPASGRPLYYSWLSKEYDMTRPCNFGAYVVKAEDSTFDLDPDTQTLYLAYNVEMMTADPPDALNPLNHTPLKGKRTGGVDVGTTPAGIDEIPQTKYPVGGSPLLNVGFLGTVDSQLILTMWADGDEVFTRDVVPNQITSMPSGYKATVWQFRLTGNADVFSFAMAETRRKLANV